MDASKWFSYARSCNYVELERHMDEYAGQTDAEGSTALMIVAEMGPWSVSAFWHRRRSAS